MCRTTVAVVLLVASLFTIVLSNEVDGPSNITAVASSTNVTNITEICLHAAKVNETRKEMKQCFSNLVSSELLHTPGVPGCNFQLAMNSYYDSVKEECHANVTVKNTILSELVNTSLKNKTFEQHDVECVKKMELNVTACVLNIMKLKSFNITSWNKRNERANNLQGSSCQVAEEVRNCTVGVLRHCNKPTTAAYLASLFDFTLKKCNDFSKGYPDPPKPKRSTALGIVIGVLVALALIATIVVLIKLRHKMGCYTPKQT